MAPSSRSRLAGWALLCLWLAAPPAPGAGAEGVRIDKGRPSWESRTYDPLAAPADLPPTHAPGEAVTVCDFWCRPIVSHRTLATEIGAKRCLATVEVVEAHVILDLTVRTWLPEQASRNLRRHEAAHREICEQVYHQSERPTREVAEDLVGRSVEGQDLDCAGAVADAVTRQAATALCGLYHTSRSQQASRIVAIYDRLAAGAKDGPNQARAAIHTAFERYRDEAEAEALAAGSTAPGD